MRGCVRTSGWCAPFTFLTTSSGSSLASRVAASRPVALSHPTHQIVERGQHFLLSDSAVAEAVDGALHQPVRVLFGLAGVASTALVLALWP